MADLATMKARLAEAETARHALAMGAQVTRARHGDTDVQYTPADLPRLDAYIAGLRADIRVAETGRRGRAIGAAFR